MSTPTNSQDYINQLKNRTYTESTADGPDWPLFGNSAWSAGGTFKVKATWAGSGEPNSQNDTYYTTLMNPTIRQMGDWMTEKWGGNANIVAEINNVVNPSQWMTQLWDYIKHMPANQFLFPGCHDALASTTSKKNGPIWVSGTIKTFTQTRSFLQMLSDGCRFFDIRFSGDSSWNIGGYEGFHSGIKFNYTVDNFANDLNTFFYNGNSIKGLNEIIICNLEISSDGTPDAMLPAVYNNFINYLRTNKGLNNIIPVTNNEPKSTLEQLYNNGDGANIIFLVNTTLPNNPGNEYFWCNKSEDCIEWGSTRAFTEINPREWYNVILENGYLSKPLTNENLFCIMSMTSTDPDPGNILNNGPISYAEHQNGPLADWLLYATPQVNYADCPPNLTQLSSGAHTELNNYCYATENFYNLVLPYKPYKDTGAVNGDNTTCSRNYNLVSMNAYEKSPFIANAITQNLVSSLNFKQLIPNGTYKILTANGGLALDADGGQIYTNGCRIQLYQYMDNPNQHWEITYDAEHYCYTIVNKMANKALDAAGQFNNKNGGKVQLWEKINSTNQQRWFINQVAGGYTLQCINGYRMLTSTALVQHNGSEVTLNLPVSPLVFNFVKL